MMGGTPASRDHIDDVSIRLGLPLPTGYRNFVERYGAGLVGSLPVFGLGPVDAMGDESVIDVNERYRAGEWPGIEDLLILSEDLGGNPIGADGSGRIWLSEHGRRELLAASFEDFVRTLLDRSGSGALPRSTGRTGTADEAGNSKPTKSEKKDE
jgi:SMI1/KNR4 family protein SUKH-1